MRGKWKSAVWRAAKFTFFSAGAGIIQIGSFTLLNELLKNRISSDMWLWTATNLPSLILSILFNFVLNRKYTFRSADNVPKCMALSFAFYLVFTPLSVWLGGLASEALANVGAGEYIVEACNMLANFVLEFLYDRFFVYRKTIDTNDRAKALNAEKAETAEAGETAADAAGETAEEAAAGETAESAAGETAEAAAGEKAESAENAEGTEKP